MAATAVGWEWMQDQPFQRRNLGTLAIGIGYGWILFIWWLGASGASGRARLTGALAVVSLLGAAAGLFRIRGVSGDLLPILEPRWRRVPMAAPRTLPAAAATAFRAQDDFPQFLGPERTGVLPGPAPDTEWLLHPPEVMWRRPVGAGWSGFAVVGARALTLEQLDDEEKLTCYDLANGASVWSLGEACRYKTTIAGEGPRSTPTVVAGRVYVLGALGSLRCVDLVTGRLLWRRSIREELGVGQPEWGFSGSPLVVDGQVIVGGGGGEGRALVAFDAVTGERRWATGNEGSSYGSPFPAVLDGVPQVLVFGHRSLVAHHPGDGHVLWEQPWGSGQPLVAVPVLAGPDRVMVTAGYGVGAELFSVRHAADGAWAVRSEWTSKRLKAKFANSVRFGNMVVGLDDGILVAVHLSDGRLLWKEGRYGHGQGVVAGGVLLLMSESGELVGLRPDPSGPHETGRFAVLSGKTWNPVALAGERLLVRNDLEAVCLRLRRPAVESR